MLNAILPVFSTTMLTRLRLIWNTPETCFRLVNARGRGTGEGWVGEREDAYRQDLATFC
jgi:hypothetical protein